MILAAALPISRACLVLCHWRPLVFPPIIAVTNFLILTAVLIGTAWYAALASESVKLTKRLNTLEGMLSICGFCKKIRTTDGHWEQLEAYIAHHSSTQFSHSICPSCAAQEYPDMFKSN